MKYNDVHTRYDYTYRMTHPEQPRIVICAKKKFRQTCVQHDYIYAVHCSVDSCKCSSHSLKMIILHVHVTLCKL